MRLRIILNDIGKSKAITFTIMVFIAAAAMLVSLASVLVVNLAGSIERLMDQARTPHFMQMHSGDLNLPGLEAFAAGNANVEDFQVLEFLNVDGSEIAIDGETLAGSVQDNGFITQSGKFDFLLDLDGNIINPLPGELYVPLCYLKDGSASTGDRVVLFGRELRVAGFLRDSQMNSSLASSKRFLVDESFYSEIEQFGNTEYLIEFRLKDISRLGEFENDYAAAELNVNGPAITYPLFKLINALSDGLMIAVLFLVSALIVAIAFLCIRFSLLAKIEEEYREIGVMKAIGLPLSDIKKIYLLKYQALSLGGCATGFGLSLLFRGYFLENIRLFMGDSGSSVDLVFGFLAVALVFLAIWGFVSSVLNRFKKISPSRAIRFGTSGERGGASGSLRLSGNRLLSVNAFLGVKDVLSRKKIYGTKLVVLVLAAFLFIVPRNLYNTISSNSFIGYMGVGDSHMRIDIQQIEDIPAKASEIQNRMERDVNIAKSVVLTTKTFKVRNEDGTEQNMKVELGDHSVFPIQYAEGAAPRSADEIALSVLMADELGKNVGDHLILVRGDSDALLIISGIYSDFTNGGKTAKALFTDDPAPAMWAVVSADFRDESISEKMIAEYSEAYDYAKVSDIDEYIRQTFGSTIQAVDKASYASMGMSLIIASLVTFLFMKMLIARDRSSIAALKAFGFTNRDIRGQYAARSLFILSLGIILGTLLANSLGEALAGALISAFGAAAFRFEVNPFTAYVLCPLLMAVSVYAATAAGTWGAGRIRISEDIKE